MEFRRRRDARGGWILAGSLIGVSAALVGAYALWPRTEPPEAVAAPPTSDTLAIFQSADRALASGAWLTAEQSYAHAIAIDSTSAAAEIGLARALVYQHRTKEATLHAQRAVDLAPRRPEAQATLALALSWAGDLDGATAAARRTIDLDPNDAEGHALLAETYADRYQLSDAWRSADRALAIAPDNPEVLRVRAYLFETAGQYADAIGAYRQAIEAAPGHSHLHFSLGTVLGTLARYDEAADAFRTAMTLAPSDARPRAGMAMLYMAQSEVPAAIPYLEEAALLDPTYATAQGQLGTARYFQGDYERAREPLEAAVRLERNKDRLSTYRHVLGWVYLRSDLLDEAQVEFEGALTLNPQFEGARDGLAAVFQKRTGPARPR
ncbi:MAG: tetratricopeptide repeat protein [Chloroflexi bacterium]|nr:tetratricopeptide repeat protein [Chloroflexota bacterium]